MKAKPVHAPLRLLDLAMSPLMRLISIAPLERPQESHAWHAQKFSADDIASIAIEKCIVVEGDDSSPIKSGFGPLFHMPLFGGWKNYIVLEVDAGIDTWHVGWIVRDAKTKDIVRAELQKLPLHEQRVRMLIGPSGRETTFCAFNIQGKQLNISCVGQGRVGDGSEYAKVRLF